LAIFNAIFLNWWWLTYLGHPVHLSVCLFVRLSRPAVYVHVLWTSLPDSNRFDLIWFSVWLVCGFAHTYLYYSPYTRGWQWKSDNDNGK